MNADEHLRSERAAYAEIGEGLPGDDLTDLKISGVVTAGVLAQLALAAWAATEAAVLLPVLLPTAVAVARMVAAVAWE